MPPNRTREPVPPSPTAEVSQAEVNRRVLALAKHMTPDEFFDLSVEVGIHKPEGGLTPEYGGAPPRKRRKQG